MSTISGETNKTNTVTQVVPVHRSASDDTVGSTGEPGYFGRDVLKGVLPRLFSKPQISEISLRADGLSYGPEVAYVAQRFLACGFTVMVETEFTQKLLVDNGVPASLLPLWNDPTTHDIQAGTRKPHTTSTQPHPSPSSRPPLNREESLPYEVRCFELWTTANPTHANPFTAVEFERWTQAIASHIQSHQEMRKRDRKEDKIERVLRHFWGFYQFRKWVIGKDIKAYEDRRAWNLKHKEECRWCRQARK
ncbi:hypothetical protein HK104_003242 [Borealophlyctis nickersoniae]|nr:hypothetical protein HK104_003242 [Borealophlyctis nickersoniae]